MKLFRILLPISISFLLTLVSFAGPEQATTIIGWLEKGVYFDRPHQIVGELVVPKIDMGPTVWHPNLKEEMWKYWYDLDLQADVLACTGPDAIPVIIKGLSSQDFYVRVIAAIALDKMMELKHSQDLKVQGKYMDLDTKKQKREPIDASFIQVYRDRFSKLYPGIQAEQGGAGQSATRPGSKSEGGDKPQPK